MSVQFAQQTELARINKRARQRGTSMQTQPDKDDVEERENKEQTPRASPTPVTWLEVEERERLERELEERNAEIRKLKEELQKTKSGPEQVSVTNWAETQNVFTHIPQNSFISSERGQWGVINLQIHCKFTVHSNFLKVTMTVFI